MLTRVELLQSKETLGKKYFNAMMSDDDGEILRYTYLLDTVEKNLKDLDLDLDKNLTTVVDPANKNYA